MKKYLISIGLIIFIFAGCVEKDVYFISKPQIVLKNPIKRIMKKDSGILEERFLSQNDNMSIKSSNIAIVFSSQVIGKYAINATNSVMSYLLYKNENFNLKVFDIAGEDKISIQNVFKDLSSSGISKVLVLFTQDGAKYLKDVVNINTYDIYMPLIHKNDLDLNIDSIVYGSIDYSKQFDEIIKYSNGKQIAFYDNSPMGTNLAKIIHKKNIDLVYQKTVDDENGEYYRFLIRKRKKLNHSTLILNTPIVKSSIILSQINANDILLSKILSMQLNYTPLLLSLTQVRDRKNMIIANSIGEINHTLEEYNAILENDLVYDWVNYATTVGIEYLITKNFNSFENIKLNNQQIEYPIRLYSTTKHSFKQLN